MPFFFSMASTFFNFDFFHGLESDRWMWYDIWFGVWGVGHCMSLKVSLFINHWFVGLVLLMTGV